MSSSGQYSFGKSSHRVLFVTTLLLPTQAANALIVKQTMQVMENISAPTSWTFIDIPNRKEHIAWYSIFALEAILIFLGNLPIIALFAMDKRLCKKSLFLIINMAFADLIYGTVLMPSKIYFMYVGRYYPFWTKSQSPTALNICYNVISVILAQGSLISAALISGERFYSIYWPLKHRKLSIRTYYIVIFISWTLAFLVSMVFSVLFFLNSIKLAVNILMLCFFTLLLIVCGCNVGIWRNSRHRRVASEQPIRDLQNRRLTKTLLLVSIIALISWLPGITVNVLRIVHEMSISWHIYHLAVAMNVSNSLINPVIYTLRIPEFRRALRLAYVRLQAAIHKEDHKRRDNKVVFMTTVNQLRTFGTDSNHLELDKGDHDTRL